MKTLWKFLGNIINSDSKESSKRLYALWAMVLVTAIVVYTLIKADATSTILNMFYALLGLVTALAGVGTIQAIRKGMSKNNADKKE